jgi:spore coat polysaccharide biosynthesis predicted glycosyltransferase SpsG
MAELMVATDLAIGAGGISTYERLYLRLPSLLKPISLNQVEPLNYMEKIGLFELFSTQKELENKLKKIIEHGIISPPDCVSNGKYKLVECMITEFTQLCVPRPLDVRRTYRWLQDKKLREDFVMA